MYLISISDIQKGGLYMPEERVIQSLQRSYDIINLFSRLKTELSLKEISQSLNLNKSTAHGLIQTMVLNGYMAQNEKNEKYKLGKNFISKSLLIPETSIIQSVSDKYLKEISEKFALTSHLLIAEGDTMYTAKINFPSDVYYVISCIIGRTVPLHATASGKLLLASMSEQHLLNYIDKHPLIRYTDKTITDYNSLKENLADIRRNGYSYENEEIDAGVISIACPLYNHFKEFFGTISISAYHLENLPINDIISYLKEASHTISKEFLSE